MKMENSKKSVIEKVKEKGNIDILLSKLRDMTFKYTSEVKQHW